MTGSPVFLRAEGRGRAKAGRRPQGKNRAHRRPCQNRPNRKRTAVPRTEKRAERFCRGRLCLQPQKRQRPSGRGGCPARQGGGTAAVEITEKNAEKHLACLREIRYTETENRGGAAARPCTMEGEITMQTAKTKRLVSAALIVLSILTLLLGWIGVKGDYRSYVKEGVKSGMESIDEYLEDYDSYSWLLGDGIKKGDLKSARRLLGMLKDGALSPLELAGIAPSFSRAVNMLSDVMGVPESMKSAAVWLWIYAVFFWAVVVVGVLTLVAHLKGENPAIGVVYAVGILVLFFLFLAFNGKLKDLSYGESVMGLTAWPFVALLAGAAALFTDRASKAVVQPAAAAVETAPADGWVCPSCGGSMGAQAAFCTKCGTARPQKAFCGSCGAELRPGAAFCTKCGARQNAEAPAAPTASEETPAEAPTTAEAPVEPPVTAEASADAPTPDETV